MKNIKNQVFDAKYDYDWYWDYENYYEYFELPFKQGMKKKIQRGLHKDSDHMKKDWHRRRDDKSPWYYASILFKNSKGKTVDECMLKFKKRFTNPYAMDAFWNYFTKRKLYRRGRGNYVEDGIIKNEQHQRKPHLFDDSNYSEKYWDKSNLRYVSKEICENYEAFQNVRRRYLKDLKEYSEKLINGITRDRWGYRLREPMFDHHLYNILIAKYPLGFDKIIEGERIPISRKSKTFIQYYREKRNSRISSKYKYKTTDYDELLKLNNKKRKKEKRKEKEEKSYFYSKNHSLHHSMSVLKDMTEEAKEWDYLLRIYDEK